MGCLRHEVDLRLHGLALSEEEGGFEAGEVPTLAGRGDAYAGFFGVWATGKIGGEDGVFVG